jgi:hypothetical protein
VYGVETDACLIIVASILWNNAFATGLMIEEMWFDFPQAEEFLSNPGRLIRLWSPTSFLSNKYLGLFFGVKLSEREANSSPPSWRAQGS